MSRALVAIPVAVQGGVESELEAPIEPPSPAFGAKGPDAVLKAARNAPPVEGFAARGVGKLAGALFWAQSIYNVLESDDKSDTPTDSSARFAHVEYCPDGVIR